MRILTRGTHPLPGIWTGRIEIVQGDLTHPHTLPKALAGCTLVYHLAGELRDPARMNATNVEGTRHLLAACQAVGVSQIVQLSSVGVIGLRRSGPVDETAPCQPQNRYEQSKHAAEQMVLAWAAQTAIPVTVLRPTIVFGERPPSQSDGLLAWLRAIQSGRFIFLDRQAVANYVYVGDVVAACFRAAQRRVTGVFIVADACRLTEFVMAATQALGAPPPRHNLPLPLAYTLAAGMQALGRLSGRHSPLTIARVQALSNRTTFRSSRIQAELGWRPAIGYRVGLQRTVQWYRQTEQL